MATKHEVIALHRQHPDWSSGEIAAALKLDPDIGGAYVRATARRNGLNLPKSRNLHHSLGLHRLLGSDYGRFADEALKRGMSVWELRNKLIRVIAKHNLFDAVLLDDGEGDQ